jgi:hypothetical protein
MRRSQDSGKNSVKYREVVEYDITRHILNSIVDLDMGNQEINVIHFFTFSISFVFGPESFADFLLPSFANFYISFLHILLVHV